MSKDIKIWLVLMAIYLGLVGGMVGWTSQIEYTARVDIPKAFLLPSVSNAITAPDYLIIEYGLLSNDEILGV